MVECKDGVCYLVEATNEVVTAAAPAVSRLAHGYMSADEFLAFLSGATPATLSGSVGAILAAVFFGGLALNLTPCVLPMIPVNAIIIGRRVRNGILYALGIALAYGALGLAAAFGGVAFGTIQSNPWFNLAVAAVFVALSLGLFGVYAIDLSRFRMMPSQRIAQVWSRFPFVIPLLMGSLSAVLAGACVAPVVISVLLLAADLGARGSLLAYILPFVLGLGMASPWPFVAAGMKVLPRPGKWMRLVNLAFGVLILCFAGWYAYLAVRGFQGSGDRPPATDGDRPPATNGDRPQATNGDRPPATNGDRPPATNGDRPLSRDMLQKASDFDDIPVEQLEEAIAVTTRPIVVDCWASWCKNCAAMEKVLAEPKVRESLRRYTVFRVQAEDLSALRKIKGFEGVKGLPAFVIFE